MSKFLKFIVNLFLICAILVAAAIIVPPLVGVGTTIVDTQLMDTNLPMGSVTYSKDVYVTELKEGDRILDENDVSAYVYTVRAIDTSNGSVTVADTFDASAAEKEIQILNSESKVILTVPYIGYVVYAMHSIEGIIILALAVLLIIILFILSELWRRDDDDEDEDEDDYDEDYEEEDEPAVRIPEPESLDLENEVDIKPYMNQENAPAEEAEAQPEQKEIQKVPETVIPAEDKAPEQETAAEETAGAATKTAEEPVPEEAEPEKEAAAAPEPEMTAEAEPAAVKEDEPAAPEEEDIDISFLEKELEAALAEPAAGPGNTAVNEAETRETVPAEEIPASPEAEEITEPAEASVQQELEEAAEKIVETEPPADVYDERRYLEEVAEEADGDPESDTFIPIARPSLETIMKGAERSGEPPVVIKEPITGLTYVDYSDIL